MRGEGGAWGGEHQLRRPGEAWLLSLLPAVNGVSTRIFETCKTACRLHLIGFCCWLTLFWEKGWGLPADFHQSICGAWEGSLQEWAGVVDVALAKARCWAWSLWSDDLSEPICPKKAMWAAFRSGAQMCFQSSRKNLEHAGPQISNDCRGLQMFPLVGAPS